MSNVLNESLYKKQKKQFDKINDLSKEFASVYCGTTILRDSIFGVVENYARKKELSLEILRYPFRDDELWAFTFVKKGTVFLCVNTDLAMCKQIFAVTHELYHIRCYADNIDQSIIRGGSILDSRTAVDVAVSQEDLEANAFAGLLLMPDLIMKEQVALFGIEGENIGVDDVLKLMELFALPYKAIILRLCEGKIITEEKANDLLKYNSDYIQQRINLTGKAKQWQLISKEMEYYGSLLDNLEFNSDHELLTDSREESDRAYLQELKKGFQKER
ncbi:MAG: ImmA/IrrE family metallo-endopeptidase [Anaerobutyricum sp.]|nr:ImmA/IrrE family metallo-endopeptidase [Anaerobutyricum sp.]